MKTEKLTFIGHSVEELAARLDYPAGKPHATAIFAHCFTCSKDIPAARRVAQRLAAMGIAVLRAAGEIEGLKAVATIGAPFDPEHVVYNFGSALDEIAKKGEAEVSLGGRPFTIKQSFVEDVSANNLCTAISGMKRALLVLHSPTDQTVGIENAGEIFGAAKHPKSFFTLDDADHLLT